MSSRSHSNANPETKYKSKSKTELMVVTPLLLLKAATVSFFNPFRRAAKEEVSGKIVVQVKWGREKWVRAWRNE